MKTYIFPIVMESAESAWHIYVPELEEKGAVTWGKTKEDALRYIQEVVQLVVEEMLQDGEALPPSVTVSEQPAVAINI
ncbi:MAG TPA: type II toxin-antitoxin system HicB family antitoxin [Candidatus Hydrogenedentes bacterium]|nr:type II toxin-antitoxin system HicB family antitoxin [Candidatus Hydrogenedentota bacterium]